MRVTGEILGSWTQLRVSVVVCVCVWCRKAVLLCIKGGIHLTQNGLSLGAPLKSVCSSLKSLSPFVLIIGLLKILIAVLSRGKDNLFIME